MARPPTRARPPTPRNRSRISVGGGVVVTSRLPTPGFAGVATPGLGWDHPRTPALETPRFPRRRTSRGPNLRDRSRPRIGRGHRHPDAAQEGRDPVHPPESVLITKSSTSGKVSWESWTPSPRWTWDGSSWTSRWPSTRTPHSQRTEPQCGVRGRGRRPQPRPLTLGSLKPTL